MRCGIGADKAAAAGIVLAAVLAALGGCRASPVTFMGAPPPDPNPIIAAGRTLWAERKPTCESYYYDRQIAGLGGRVGGTMTVQIVNDQPQWRWYIGLDLTADNPGPIEWFEDMTMLGEHEGAPAASTVEELWNECVTALAGDGGIGGVDPLQVNEEGVPTTCGNGSNECPTGGNAKVVVRPNPACTTGIFLTGFVCGTLAPPTAVTEPEPEPTIDGPVDAGAD
jgi:hypothetical protein